MKQTKKSTKSGAPRELLDPQRFPQAAQTEATEGRQKVRQVAHRVDAPRDTGRRAEKKK